jgi:hypothetical protein
MGKDARSTLIKSAFPSGFTLGSYPQGAYQLVSGMLLLFTGYCLRVNTQSLLFESLLLNL